MTDKRIDPLSVPEAANSRGQPNAPTVATNVKRVNHQVESGDRAHRNGHRGGVFWLTGLSGAGKSTITIETERRLFEKNFHVYALDGDNLRLGLNADLAFGSRDRSENIRRASAVSALFADAGMVAISAFISPYEADRAMARKASNGLFREVYIKASIETCEFRDPKGLYRRARAGEIKDFTGISAPYEIPTAPDLILDTEQQSIEECVRQLEQYIVTVCKL